MISKNNSLGNGQLLKLKYEEDVGAGEMCSNSRIDAKRAITFQNLFIYIRPKGKRTTLQKPSLLDVPQLQRTSLADLDILSLLHQAPPLF